MGIKANARRLLRMVSVRLPRIGRRSSSVTVLMYHSVGGHSPMELDVDPQEFDRQMAWIATNARAITPEEFIKSGGSDAQAGDGRPSFLITFDDAYADFWENAYPVLKQWRLPSLLFVPTGFVSGQSPVPITSRERSSSAYCPMSWEQIRHVVREGLVTIGAHSHSHREFAKLSPSQIESEIAVSDEIFLREIGSAPDYFAYPRGSASRSAVSLVSKRYSAGFGVGRLMFPKVGTGSHLRARLPVMRSDGQAWFQQRVEGRLWLEECCADLARLILRRAGAY